MDDPTATGATTERMTEEQVRAAVDVANVPSLLMVLFQFSGDERWLAAPYLPTRGKGLVDHDSGGLPEPVQAEIREASVGSCSGYRTARGRRSPLPPPN
ncbi:MAG: hypothetical protein L0I76_07205 [Pseudonocardia sp.]|nr:hypothetical protein [Pseudonocardia sp.]